MAGVLYCSKYLSKVPLRQNDLGFYIAQKAKVRPGWDFLPLKILE